MARIELIGSGERCDFSVLGTVVSVGGLTVDCSDYQADSEEICLDICREGDAFVVGTAEGRAYVISIIIPPKTYEEVSEGVDENGDPITQRVAAAMDPAQLLLKLWPYRR